MSNSWLPTAEASRPSAFSTSMVGWSCWHRGGEHRGADEVTGADERGCRSAGARVSQLLDRAGPLHRVGVDAAVEVVDAERFSSTGAAAVATSSPTTTGSWSEARNGLALVEVRGVVVVAAVLERDRLAGVDVPDVGAGRPARAPRRWRARGPASRTGRRRSTSYSPGGVGLEVGVARAVEHLQRVLLGVGVEVAGEERLVGAPVGVERVGEGRRGPAACATRSRRWPLPWPSARPSVPEPLDLKWLTITANVVASAAGRLEGLGQRLAGVGERRGAARAP